MCTTCRLPQLCTLTAQSSPLRLGLAALVPVSSQLCLLVYCSGATGVVSWNAVASDVHAEVLNGLQGMEPLLIVTPERQYTAASSADARPMQSYEMFAAQATEAPLSAYNAAFGEGPAAQPLEQPVPAPAALGTTQRDLNKRVQELFDMPSHTIPALEQLLGNFVLAVSGQRPTA